MKYFFLTLICFQLALFSQIAEATKPTNPYKYFDNHGVKIAYRIFESNPLATTPVLFLLNGGPGRSSDSFTPLAQKLSTLGQRVVLFDQRGTGRSNLPSLDESSVTLDLMVSDLEALRHHLNYQNISILGHSFGGMYAMAYAV
ncbi:MAG: alpha/beta hydrolase, partial [Bdellovibrionales bacterium]|nr:alpha/beta hydrolase [Bdellovibrionales bacterium]